MSLVRVARRATLNVPTLNHPEIVELNASMVLPNSVFCQVVGNNIKIGLQAVSGAPEYLACEGFSPGFPDA